MFDEGGVGCYLKGDVAAFVCTAHGGVDAAAVCVVERGVVGVVAHHEGAHRILLGEVYAYAVFKVGELVLAVLARREHSGCGYCGNDCGIFADFHVFY